MSDLEALEERITELEDSLNSLIKTNGKLTIKSRYPADTQYARADWCDPNGFILFTVASHVWTNFKTVGTKVGRYLHNHTSFYTRTFSNQMEHALDITHSEQYNQIHMRLPTFFDGSVYIKNRDGKLFEILIDDFGVMKGVRVSTDTQIKVNKAFNETL